MAALAIAANLFKTDVIESRKIRLLLGGTALTFCMALGAGARILLPWTPVPFTMQVFFVPLAQWRLEDFQSHRKQGIWLLALLVCRYFPDFKAGSPPFQG